MAARSTKGASAFTGRHEVKMEQYLARESYFRKLQKYFDFKKEFLKIKAPARRDYLNILRLYESKYPHIDSESEDDLDDDDE